MNIILRRRKLGRGSATGIANFSTTGITPIRNWTDEFPEQVGFVFRWGCTSNTPESATVVNSASSIHWCSDKRQGRLDMQAAGVSVPQTWGSFPEFCSDYGASNDLPIGVIVRPIRHAQGRHLATPTVLRGVEQALIDFGGGYISELINKVAEYRVFVVQNRVGWVARKTPGNPEDVAWNVARGGRFDNVRWSDWPKAVIVEALKAAKVSGCDFCGVDVMVDAEGKAYVLEVNSAPSQTSEYRQRCVAKCFDYIVTHGKEHFPDVEPGPRRTWKSYIHPALRENDGQISSSS